MEAAKKRFSLRLNSLIGLLALGVAMGTSLSGCSSAGKSRSGDHSSGAYSPQGNASSGSETFGPPVPVASDQTTNTYGPEPISFRPVVLVLGPGMARGFAYVGAIRALVAAKVPIGAVLGTEMGALIGSLYAMGGKINQFEWALLKFNEDSFVNPNSMVPALFQKKAKTKKLESELARVFSKKDLSQSLIPLRVAAKSGDSVNVIDRGLASSVVHAAMADPELFDEAKINDVQMQSAAKQRPFLISEARALGLGPVVVISAMDEEEEKNSASAGELKDADLVIRPTLNGIGRLDFARRTDAAFQGKRAVDEHLDEIKQLVGMPREADPQKGNAP